MSGKCKTIEGITIEVLARVRVLYKQSMAQISQNSNCPTTAIQHEYIYISMPICVILHK